MAKITQKISMKTKDGGKNKQETVEDEEFKEFAENLEQEFQGIMRLWGESGEKIFTASLLVDKGKIIGTTYEEHEEAHLEFGPAAYEKIITEFSGKAGDLEIFSLDSDGLERILKENEESKLKPPRPLTELKIKIKPKLKPQTGQKGVLGGLKGMFSGKKEVDDETKKQRLKQLRQEQLKNLKKISVGEGFNLVDFARDIMKEDPLKAQRLKELREKKLKNPENGLKDKKIQFKKLKKNRDKLKKGAEKKIFGKQEQAEKEKETLKPRVGGEKIETAIDRFYNLLKKKKQLKITEQLARELKITKTKLEGWAMILEEHELLELHYPTIGEPIVNIKQEQKKQE